MLYCYLFKILKVLQLYFVERKINVYDFSIIKNGEKAGNHDFLRFTIYFSNFRLLTATLYSFRFFIVLITVINHNALKLVFVTLEKFSPGAIIFETEV